MIYKTFSPENLNGHYPQDRGKIVIVKDDDGVARVENQGGEFTRSFLAMAAGALGRYIRNEVDDEGSIDICKTAFNDELDYPRSNGGDLKCLK